VSETLPLQVGMEPYPGCKLRQPLGKGGFAEVWEGEEVKGHFLALKFIPSRDDMSTSREIKAIQAVRKLQHPGLIHIDNVLMNWGYIIVAMEVAEGSLADLLDAYREEFQSPILPEQVCYYLAQVADALDFLHARTHMMGNEKVGIQHCDIKPSNMLLFGETVKLADFGLSSPMIAKRMPHRRAGTLDYAAPEVFRGELTDQTDQYALAVTYCLLRGGQVPFPDTPQKFDQTYVRPEPILTMLTEPERPIIARALSAAAQNRWPSCTELIGSLAKVTCGAT
jgi:serine/threonine protein kinase, bacterial